LSFCARKRIRGVGSYGAIASDGSNLFVLSQNSTGTYFAKYGPNGNLLLKTFVIGSPLFEGAGYSNPTIYYKGFVYTVMNNSTGGVFLTKTNPETGMSTFRNHPTVTGYTDFALTVNSGTLYFGGINYFDSKYQINTFCL
jgi:hypothetical protein